MAYPKDYRVAFLQEVLNVVGRPLFLAALISKLIALVSIGFPTYAYTLLYILAIPVYWTIHNQINVLTKRRKAASMGAVLPPEVNGKWLGNFDLMLK
jgi:hypothetical protein